MGKKKSETSSLINRNLEAALYYSVNLRFSVIPVRSNKKPFIQWIKHQTERADMAQIETWWRKWPSANIGIVTGAISGMNVIDGDTEQGWAALNEFLSDSFQTPMCRTPSGGYHVYFDYKSGLSNGVRILEGCDLRTDGGYVVAPPSKNGNGKEYLWFDGLKPHQVAPVAMPDILFDTLQQGGGAIHANFREHIKKVNSFNKKKSYRTGDFQTGDFNRLQVTSSDFKMFEKGQRDESLFHIANCLVKGGMETKTIHNVLKYIALNCNPPFSEKEVKIKIESALKRKDRQQKNISEEVRDFVVTSSGFFLTSDVFNRLQVTSRSGKKAVVLELLRLKDKGIIERHGEKDGCYRKIEADCEPENWKEASTDTVDLWLPFELDQIAIIPPGAIVTLAGSPNSGKTAIMLNIAKENRHKWNVHYFSSELGPGAFKRRVKKFRDIMPEDFNVDFYQRSDNFQDVVKQGAGNLNLIDYMELYENFYLVAKHLADIYKKLNGAVCIVAIQKNENRKDAHGGSFGREKPTLSLSLDSGKIKIIKLKEWREGLDNPNGKEYRFKLIDGCRFKKEQGWHYPME